MNSCFPGALSPRRKVRGRKPPVAELGAVGAPPVRDDFGSMSNCLMASIAVPRKHHRLDLLLHVVVWSAISRSAVPGRTAVQSLTASSMAFSLLVLLGEWSRRM